jgi:hypothetical protein
VLLRVLLLLLRLQLQVVLLVVLRLLVRVRRLLPLCTDVLRREVHLMLLLLGSVPLAPAPA